MKIMYEDQIQSTIFFIKTLSDRELAEYIISLSQAVDGFGSLTMDEKAEYDRLRSKYGAMFIGQP